MGGGAATADPILVDSVTFEQRLECTEGSSLATVRQGPPRIQKRHMQRPRGRGEGIQERPDGRQDPERQL